MPVDGQVPPAIGAPPNEPQVAQDPNNPALGIPSNYAPAPYPQPTSTSEKESMAMQNSPEAAPAKSATKAMAMKGGKSFEIHMNLINDSLIIDDTPNDEEEV